MTLSVQPAMTALSSPMESSKKRKKPGLEHGSRLLPYLPIEIRGIVRASLTEPPQPIHCTRGSWLKYARLSFAPQSGPDGDDKDFFWLHRHLHQSRAVFVNEKLRLVALPLPDLAAWGGAGSGTPSSIARSGISRR